VSDQFQAWLRPRFVPGGANAVLLYALYGRFDSSARAVRPADYRTEGLPPEFEVRKVTAAGDQVLPFMGGELAGVLRTESPELWARAAQAPECLILKGEFSDPPTLNYLRDTVGMIAWFFDQGAVAVLDPQRLKIYGPVEWWDEVFAPTPPRLSSQVVIVSSAEPDGGRRLHTRGMRKFGRPDLNIRSVPLERERAAIDLINRLIVMQAEGGRVPEGQSIQLRSLPPGLTCHHAGSVDDPEFNNSHVEILQTRDYSF